MPSDSEKASCENPLKVDQLFNSFSSQASQISTIGTLSFASLCGNFTRFGALSFLNGLGRGLNGFKSLASQLVAIPAEALVLEGMNHYFQGSQNSSFLDSFLHSAITLTAFRLSSPLINGQGFFVQQALQASALVSAQHMAAHCGVTASIHENLADEFTAAFASNLSLTAASQFGNRLIGGKIHLLESYAHISGEIRNQASRGRESRSVNALQYSANPAPDLQSEFHERAIYSHRLLEFSLDAILQDLRMESSGVDHVPDWLEAVRLNHQWAIEHWPALEHESRISHLTQNDNDGGPIQFQEALLLELSECYHTEKQLRLCYERVRNPLRTEEDFWDVRRRLESVLARPRFAREIDWSEITPIPDFFYSDRLEDRYEIAKNLLLHLHPNLTREDIQVFDDAAGGENQNRHIAFDLDNTLGDTFQWHLAQDALSTEAKREAYDISDFDYFAYQRSLMRIPFARMQATLLGLWAAGNTIKLYTHSPNRPETHEAFFNDFPLLKVAFGFASPADVFQRITPESLHASPNYMDEIKRAEFQVRHFGTEAGREFAAQIFREAELRYFNDFKNSKIPFPDFYFDVLVDDTYFFAGEMQTLGFGRRFVEAVRNGEKLIEALENFFHQPAPPTTPTLERWLQGEASGRDGIQRDLEDIATAGSDPERQSQRARLFLENWARSQSTAPNFLYLIVHSARLNTGMLSLLAQASIANPLIAKMLFVRLTLLPAQSPLRYDPAVLDALSEMSKDIWSGDDLDSLTQHLCLRYHSESRLAPPDTETVSAWRNRIFNTPAAWIEFLHTHDLTPEEFRALIENLNLHQ